MKALEELQEIVDTLVEAGPTGKGQKAIMQALKGSKGEVDFTDLVSGSQFRLIGFEKLLKAAEALAKKGLVKFDRKKISL